MFYKIGFWVLLAIVLACVGLFMFTNPMKNNGAMSWVDVYSNDPTATLKFMNDTFDIRVTETSVVPDGGGDYNVIKSKGSLWPFAGVMKAPEMHGHKVPAGTMIYLTVTDYAMMSAKMVANGAKPIEEDIVAAGMRFGVYEIPGGLTIGIAQYGVK